MDTSIPFHPVSEVFPLLEGEAFEAFKADIAENGLREQLWTWQGAIIDGRNRLRACIALGIKPATREWDGKGSLVRFVLSLNLHRRHLSPSQGGMAATNALPFLQEEAKRRQSEGGKTGGNGRPQIIQKKVCQIIDTPIRQPDRAAQEAAELFHTNRQYVHDAQKIKAESPELATKVLQGELSIPQAKKRLQDKASGNGKRELQDWEKWDVTHDISKLRAAVERLRHNWKSEADKTAMRQFFKQLVSEV